MRWSARQASRSLVRTSLETGEYQPLAGIVTNANTCQRMLAAAAPKIDGALETARRTIRDANRASEVIARLRALFNRKETATESVDLNEAVREVIALSLSGLQRNAVVVRTELADDLPCVIGDRIQLQQVVLNLLRNGSDAMSKVDNRPRHLVITTDQDAGDRVRLSVKDVGVGFEPLPAAGRTTSVQRGKCSSRSIYVRLTIKTVLSSISSTSPLCLRRSSCFTA
jgi:C4-dicarboxylate-specific signal transduction histidine kinase